MAKRDSNNKKTAMQRDTTPQAAASDAMEQRIVAFAEQIGRIAGTVSAKTEGLIDREALKQQISGVRDSASELLEHLSDGVTTLAKRTVGKTAVNKTPAARTSSSVDPVHARGKKHRKPMPKDPRAAAADAKRATVRANTPSMKTMKTRGRG